MAGDFSKIVIFELMGLFVVVGLLLLSTYKSIINAEVSFPFSNDKWFGEAGKALFSDIIWANLDASDGVLCGNRAL